MTEVIIVIAVFILIIVVVYSVYALSQNAYSKGERLAEVVQNARVILERASREIRQAREIVTELPDEKIDASSEIQFEDGHTALVFEEGDIQAGTESTVTFSSLSSDVDDYYKDMFVKITAGAGLGQIRKITSYDGLTKTAELSEDWDTIPNATSDFKIDSFFNYIHYYLDEENKYVLREVFAYCISDDEINCVSSEGYVSWDMIPPEGQSLLKITLEEALIVGEYVTDLDFWGSGVIGIFLTLEKHEGNAELETKIYGRNL